MEKHLFVSFQQGETVVDTKCTKKRKDNENCESCYLTLCIDFGDWHPKQSWLNIGGCCKALFGMTENICVR